VDTQVPVSARYADNRVDLADLLHLFRSGWWRMVIGAVVGFILATIALFLSPAQYTAHMVIGPVQDNSSSLLSGRLGQFSSLASLAGVNLGAADNNVSFTILREVLKSQRLYETLDAKHQVIRQFFPAAWDAEKGGWKEPSGIVPAALAELRRVLGFPPHPNPTMFDLMRGLERRYQITQVQLSGLYRLTMVSNNPEFARDFLNWVLEESDRMVREDVMSRTTTQIRYIEDRLKTVTVQEHRSALLQLLIGQEQQRMLMASGLPFAATVIQPATVTDYPTSPRPSLYWLFGIFLGVLAGAFYHIARWALAK
jgi:Chain length determinant protein